ncbi:alpha/beta hydrolase [Aureliella helgolandensis]|nr:alpha/beta hydrolase [Aureliella helgolandensis]
MTCCWSSGILAWLTCGLVAFSAQGSMGAEPAARELTYATVNGTALRLDLYIPDGAEAKRPLIVWVHGGAWRSGDKADVPIRSLLKRGMAIASVNYRLSPQAMFPAQVHDIKAAIRYLRHHAADWNLDDRRFIIAGSSAGGHLAALVGVSHSVPELEGQVGQFREASSQVQGIISFYGASNLETILAQSTPHGLNVRIPALNLLLGGHPEEHPELARLASPVAHVTADDPPLWLIHGDQDPQMPINQSHELVGAYERLDLPVNLEVVYGGKHGGDLFFTDQRLDRLADEVR